MSSITKQDRKISRSPRSVEAIEAELEEMILNGTLCSGARINEKALAVQLGAGRASVREACRLLERTGLVRIIPNQGACVRTLDLNEILQIFDIRSMLGRLAGREAALNATPDQIRQLQRLVDEMQTHSLAQDVMAYMKLNTAFHHLLYDAGQNPRLTTADQTLSKEVHIFRRRDLPSGEGLIVSNHEHQLIVHAVGRRDQEEASRLVEQHIRAGKERFFKALYTTGQIILQPRAGKGTAD